MYRSLVAVASLMLGLSASASAASAEDITETTSTTSRGTGLRVELGRSLAVDCADGTAGATVHNVVVVARQSVARDQDVQQRAREIEVRYEVFHSCDFTSTVGWGSLVEGGIYEQTGVKDAVVRATIPLRDSVTGLPSGEVVIDVTLSASGEPVRTRTRDVHEGDGVRIVQRAILWSVEADVAGVVRINGVDQLPLSEFVGAQLFSHTTSVHTKTTAP